MSGQKESEEMLNSNTRTYSDVALLNGDVVYYKRKDSRKWKGPATVLGKDGQQVLLKQGGYYVRVHPCKLRLANCNAQQSSNKEDTTETKQTESADPSNGREGVHDTDSDTSDSDDDVVQERNDRAPSVSSNQLTPPPTPQVI